tara:strand:+ start:21937 stop:23121 length:1185 start_codon:yes stop_codon:yes gene_type:complete
LKKLQYTAFIGSYEEGSEAGGGGIYTVNIEPSVCHMQVSFFHNEPKQAGYLYFNAESNVLYAVDERKTPGRNAKNGLARVVSLKVSEKGQLSEQSILPAPGPRPTYLDANIDINTLFCANHGDFQHIEKVVKGPDGKWHTEYYYDDSTVIAYSLDEHGALAEILDVVVFSEHGKDPNFSPQNGGHAQASAHAHCVVVSPSGQFVFVCDKGTDRIYVYTFDKTFDLVCMYQMPEESGPRHLAYHEPTHQILVTCEFASKLAIFQFNPDFTTIQFLQWVQTTSDNYQGVNEPAHVCLHPTLPVAYINNRGEDSIVWFNFEDRGIPVREGGVSLSKSIHPGLAARSFCFTPCGHYFLVADRSANLLRLYSVDNETGALSWKSEISIPDPAYVCVHAL